MTTPAVPARHSIKIRFLDVEGNPIKNVRCDVDTDKETVHLGISTDGAGVLAFVVPAKKPIFLTLHMFPELLTFRVEVETYGGGDTTAGARARLHNLGYIALKDTDAVNAPADDLLARGLDRFRFANGFVDQGNAPEGPMQAPFDAKTKRRLEDVHEFLGPLSP